MLTNLEFSANVLDLLKERGFFPYDYWDSFEKFKEALPRKDKFDNTLNNCAISYKNYKRVFNVFKMNNIKDYHDLYLKVYFLLLPCVFETFRKESINLFELNSAHYFSTPVYSWEN